MAIKMLREPSETPNINNIDDIVGLRYAYGNQDGFVKGKGTEISSTTESAAIRINSGRIVLQGVECDIDAAGVRLAIDNIATRRYYVVYLEVNLALNRAELKLSFGTSSYPTIEAGDDLTTSSTGVARLPIYKFEAINGVISSVNKIIEVIKYTEDIKVKNALNADSAKDVTQNINGKAISSIFENDGITAKKATDVSNLKLYQHNVTIIFGDDSFTTQTYIVNYQGINRVATEYTDSKTFLNDFLVNDSFSLPVISGVFVDNRNVGHPYYENIINSSYRKNANDINLLVMRKKKIQGYDFYVPTEYNQFINREERMFDIVIEIK